MIDKSDAIYPSPDWSLLKGIDAAVDAFSHSKRVGDYLLGDSIGRGAFADVRDAMHTVTSERVAVKIVDKKRCQSDRYMRKHIGRETRVLAQLRHPYVIRLLEVLDTNNNLYLVLKRCPGALIHVIKEKGKLDEETVRRYLSQIIVAVDYLHRGGVMHRDIKVENILLSESGQCKLIDFGLSALVHTTCGSDGSLVTQLCKTQCGSPAYTAPEVLARKSYGHKADIWSIGVTMYAMLEGYLPFHAEAKNTKELCRKMMARERRPFQSALSNACVDLLNQFLEPDQTRRITLQAALRHPWFRNVRMTPLPITDPVLNPDFVNLTAAKFGMESAEVSRVLVAGSPSRTLSTYMLLEQRFARLGGPVTQKRKKKCIVEDGYDSEDSWVAACSDVKDPEENVKEEAEISLSRNIFGTDTCEITRQAPHPETNDPIVQNEPSRSLFIKHMIHRKGMYEHNLSNIKYSDSTRTEKPPSLWKIPNQRRPLPPITLLKPNSSNPPTTPKPRVINWRPKPSPPAQMVHVSLDRKTGQRRLVSKVDLHS